MLEKLRKFFSAPVFEDEGVNFNARNLNVVLLSVFVGIAVTILRYIALGKFWLGNAGVVFLVTGVVIVGAYILFQKRYFLASSMIAIVVLTLMPFALILMSGNGIHDTAIMILPVVVVITSMLLSWQGLAGYVVFVALAFGVLVRMEVNHHLATPFSSLTTNSDFTDALTILIVAALMSGLLVTSLRRNLRRLSDALKEREASEERYRLISNLSSDYVFSSTVHKNGTITHDWQSGAFESISGYTPEEFLDHGGWRSTLHPDDLIIDDQMLEKMLLNQKVMDELRVLTKNGDIRWVRVYAQPVWDAIENRLAGIYGAVQNVTEEKIAEEKLRQHAEQLALLNEVGRSISSLRDLDSVLKATLEQMKKILPLDVFYVGLYHPMTNTVSFPIMYDSEEFWQEPETSIDSQTSWVAQVRSSRQPFLIKRTSEELTMLTPDNPVGVVEKISASVMMAPMEIDNRFIGVVSIHSYILNTYGQDDLMLLNNTANQIAIAVENARLFSEVQQELAERKRAEDTLRQRDAILQGVAHAAQVLLQSSDWRESINQILDELGGATGASHVYIFENHVLANDNKVTSLKYEWTSPNSNPDIDKPQYQNAPLFEDDKMYWSGILSKGQTYIGDMDKLPVEEAEHFRLQGIKSILDVPIFVGGEWWGVIGFDDLVNVRAWSQAEIEALKIAGKMMGAAIEREQIDESLRTSEERYRRAISANDSVPYTLDYQKDEYTFMGEMIDQITGYPVNEITPDKMRVLIQETIMRGDLDGYSRSEATQLIRTGGLHPGSWRADLRIITKDRDERWLSDSSIQILDRNGKPIGSIGILQDITDRKLIEVNLRKRESLLNAITFSAEQFLKTPKWREKIDIVLGELGREFSASHAYVFEKHKRADGVILNSLRYEWVAPGQNSDMDSPAYQNAPIHQLEYARYYEILDSGKPFVGGTSYFLESESEKAWMNSTSIKALLEMRIVVNGVQWGTIGFDDMVSEREWNPMEVDVIKIAANVLAAAIEREQADNIIRQSEEKHRNELEGQVIERTSQLTAANKLLQTEKARIEQVVDEVATLRRLSDFLQSSMTVEEASSIVASHMSSLFANTSGGLYLIHDGFIDLALMSSWGEFKTETVIQPNDCWGMRRGRSFVRHTSDASPACAHFDGEIPVESLCLPLMGQNEIIGMLCLQVSKNEEKYFTPDIQNLAIACADSVALALANLRLRERLHNQSVRDPLTGLFNRRYLEETLARETHRASRSQDPLCVIMFEVDDFKIYNNTFGHEAGDYVLRKVADTMRANLRRSDFPCRYGGDEFTLLLPETTLQDGAHRAEELRKSIEVLALSYNNQALGQVTVRMGVAVYPKHGETGEAVLKIADDASYRARAIGKNCVVVAE